MNTILIPFSAFPESPGGVRPNFRKLSLADHGRTIALGSYEAAVDALLYERDSDYRWRFKKLRRDTERGLGASLARLRKQRRLRQDDFEPYVSSKQIARIECGMTKRPRTGTLRAIAKRLGVTVDQLAEF